MSFIEFLFVHIICPINCHCSSTNFIEQDLLGLSAHLETLILFGIQINVIGGAEGGWVVVEDLVFHNNITFFLFRGKKYIHKTNFSMTKMGYIRYHVLHVDFKRYHLYLYFALDVTYLCVTLMYDLINFSRLQPQHPIIVFY